MQLLDHVSITVRDLGMARTFYLAVMEALGAQVAYDRDPVFNLDVPRECPGVPADVLRPKGTWKDASAYDAQAAKLARMFHDNFVAFADHVSASVKAAGPHA